MPEKRYNTFMTFSKHAEPKFDISKIKFATDKATYEKAVDVLLEYAKLKPSCIDSFEKLIGKETCFDWEEPLLKVYRDVYVHN